MCQFTEDLSAIRPTLKLKSLIYRGFVVAVWILFQLLTDNRCVMGWHHKDLGIS